MKDIDKAVASFKEGLNCAQAVVAVYAPSYGLGKKEAIRIAAGFGGGLGHTGRTCGAITGALMVIGLHCSAGDVSNTKAKKNSYARSQEFFRKFEARHGSTDCRTLLGQDISTAEGMKAAREKGLCVSLCPDFVRSAAEIVEELLKD